MQDEIKALKGIIPAYAGSTSGGEIVLKPEKDHPRIRGEHDQYPLTVNDTMGSSPHTRGALGVA